MEKLNRERINRLLLQVVLLSASATCTGSALHAQTAGDATGIKDLLMKAQALAAHGHLEIAVQTWQQVLLSDPANREALKGLSKADMQLGRTEEARQYLRRLSNISGNDKDVQEIASMPSVQSQNVRLAEAGKLAQGGNPAAAMRIYRDVLGDEPPAGNWALAYYDTEAGIPASRQHAIDGLRRLAKQYPADSRYAVTLGRVLTYEPKTRTEGMELLSQYGASASAQAALQQARQWSGAANAATGTAGQAKHETNSPTTEAEATKPAVPAGNPHNGAGYRALNSGRLDEAEQQFREALKTSAKDPQALSGLGYVRLKQHAFAEAADYLERARAAGATGKGLEDGISLARFWEAMGAGADAQKQDKTAEALAEFQRARLLRPSSPEAMEGAAGALMQAGNSAEAATVYAQELQTAPHRMEAWRGLLMAQTQNGDMEAAVNTAGRIPRDLRASLERDPGYLTAVMRASLATGHKAEADQAVEHALSLPFPDHGRGLPLDQQLQYAGLLLSAQHYAAALSLYRQIVTEEPENAGAWRALIAAQHQLHHDEDALNTVSQMPSSALGESEKREDFLALLGSVYQGLDETARAQQYLERALALGGPDARGLRMQLASIYAARGEEQKALDIYSRELNTDPSSRTAWSGLLGALHSAHHDQEAIAKLATIPEMTRLRLEQDPDFLQVLASIQSDSGNKRAALHTFDRLLAIYQQKQQPEPVDAEIQHAWLLMQAGQDARLYSMVQAIAATPDLTPQQQKNFHAMWAAWTVRRSQSALAAGDRAGAISMLEMASRAFPQNLDITNALATAYQQSGEPQKAVAIYASLDLSNATPELYQSAVGAALAANDTKDAEVWLELALDHYRENAALLRQAAQYEQARGDQRKATAYYRAALEAIAKNPAANAVSGPNGTMMPGGDSPQQDLLRMMAPRTETAQLSRENESPQETSAYARIPQADAPRSQSLGDYAQPADAQPQNGYGGMAAEGATETGDFGADRKYNEQPQLSMNSSLPQEGEPYRYASGSLGDVTGDTASMQFDQPRTLAQNRTPEDETAGRGGQHSTFATQDEFMAPAAHSRLVRLAQQDADLPPLEKSSKSRMNKQGRVHLEPTGMPVPPDIISDTSIGRDEDVPTHFEPVDTPAPEQPAYHLLPAAQNTSNEGAGALQNAAAALRSSRSAQPAVFSPQVRSQDRDQSTNGEVSLPALSAPGRATAQSQGLQGANTGFGEPTSAPGTSSDLSNLPPLRGAYSLRAKPLPMTPREQVQQQLALIESGNSSWMGGSSSIAYRSGQPGLDRLSIYSAQVESSGMLGPNARLSVISKPVLLDAGTATGTATVRQGTLALTDTPSVQSASGVGGEVQLRTSSFAVSGGYTPYGFLVSNVIGAVTVHPPASHFTLSVAREAVQDTQLSYAGLRDTGSRSAVYAGNVWGGVVTTGGELQITSGDASAGWYVQGGGQYITGVHVLNNKRIDGDAGAYWGVWHNPAYGSLTLGANFFGMHYQDNLRYFTYGHGGYFSPNAYMLGNVPVSFAGHYGPRLHYRLAGSLGIQAFSESSSAYFPLDMATQIAQGNPYYPEQTSVGANYDLDTEAAYTIREHWYVGAYLSANNARDYQNTRGGFYIRYMFRPQVAVPEQGPTGLFSMQGLRPLRVP